MHDVHLGALGQQGSTFTVLSQRGERPYCPTGSQEQSRHGSGIRESVTCYRAPVFAPPATTTVSYEAPRTAVTVSPSLQTAISPMISPVMGQQMASPGAGITAAPTQVAPAPMTRQTGITGADLERILAAQRAADEAEREARERKATAEMTELTRQMAERSRTQDEIYQAQRADEARRIDAERFAREQAELEARESAGAIPPPPSFTAAPSPMQAPMLTEAQMTAGDVTMAPPGDGEAPPWILIALAAAGIGAAVMLTGKKGKRRKKR
jgi:hypothetical protein